MEQFKNMLAKFAKNLRKQSNEKKVLGKFDLVLSLKSNRRPRKAKQDESEIQKILSKIAHDSEFLQIITEKPQALAQEFDLDKDDIKALQAADLLIAAQSVNPLLQQSEAGTAATMYFPPSTIIAGTITGSSTITTDTGSTCTVTNNGPIVSIASTVESLKDKDSIYLSDLIQRLVEDEEFYEEVRSYFGH